MISIVPAPREVAYGTGSFDVSASTRIVATRPEGRQVARYFADLLQRTRSVALAIAPTGDAEGAINFELLAGEDAGDAEDYSLTISPGRIVVSARGPRGLFHGAVTLWQVMTSNRVAGSELQVPAMTVVDAPRFRWRGLLVDSARHYQSPQFIKRLIDVMALHKLNVLHWHLTDDQGWRLQIRKYPQLTAVGAWRVPAGPAAAADIDSATGRSRLYGGFYSQEQVRDIVAHAAARNIAIVPEIEMPGHASAAIAAYPQLGVFQKASPPKVSADWGMHQTLFNVEEATFEFLEHVLDEAIELFPGQYIHIGGDEAAKDQWQASPRVQARMRELGVKDEHALQSYFIQRMEKFLNAKGRRLIGWDEILEGGLAPNATVMSWRGIDGAVAAATAGHDAVLSPAPTLYFDNRPVAAPSPPGRGAVIDMERVYRFDPAPAALSEPQRRHILGVQANVWTEHVRTEDRFEYMTFPRAAALAEVAWSSAERMDWNSFKERLPAQFARYETLGVRYAGATPVSTSHGHKRTSHELRTCGEGLVLSLEDDAPVRGERAVFLVDLMNPCWIYQGADLSRVSGIKAWVGQVPFNFQIGADVHKIPLRKPESAAGELEVRLDGCQGERIAVLPLAPAATNYAVTTLPPAPIHARDGKHDLCFMFTQAGVDPTWVVDAVELVER
jgi:hexosaminidase